jgi:hypothetical protein
MGCHEFGDVPGPSTPLEPKAGRLLPPKAVLAEELLPDGAGGALYRGAATDDSPWPDVVAAEALVGVAVAAVRTAARTTCVFGLTA